MEQKENKEDVKGSYYIRVFWFAMCCGHVLYAGPFGLRQMTDYRYWTSIGVCLVGAGTLRLIEIILNHLGCTHLPKRGVLYLILRILLFMAMSIVLNTTFISLFLYLCDHTSGIDHSSWQSIGDVFISLVWATILIGGAMIYSDLKDLNKAKEKKSDAQNEESKEKTAESTTSQDTKKIERIEYEGHKIITLPDNLSIPPFDSADFVYSTTNGNYTKLYLIKGNEVTETDDIFFSCANLYEFLKIDTGIQKINRHTLLNIHYIKKLKGSTVTIKGVDIKESIGRPYKYVKDMIKELHHQA